MGEGCQAYGVYELTGYKNLREEPNLAVKIILSDRRCLVTVSSCAREGDKAHVCMLDT